VTQSEAKWGIGLFGTFELYKPDGQAAAFHGRKAGALLAYLALHLDTPFTREHLAELLWPESDPVSKRTRLRQELAALRALFGAEEPAAENPLLVTRTEIRLEEARICTDVARFRGALQAAAGSDRLDKKERRLAEAVGLYRADLLTGYDEGWIAPLRSELMQQFEKALRDLATVRQTQGDLAGAEASLKRLLAHDPLLEEAHADLMRLYAAQGQPTQAQRQYRQLERLLREELDEEPTEATKRLAEELRRKARLKSPIAVPAAPEPPSNGIYAAGEYLLPEKNGIHPTAPPLRAPSRTAPLYPAPPLPSRLRGRFTAGLLTMLAGAALLACLWPLLRHRPAKAPALPPARPASEPPLLKPDWTYADIAGTGEKQNSEPRAMTYVEGKASDAPGLYVTGLVQTEKEDADILTFKLSPQGKLLWRDRYSSPEHDCDRAYSIAPDLRDGVFVAGETYVPEGHGVPEGWRIVTLHYDARGKDGKGNRLWVRRSQAITKNDGNVRVCMTGDGGCLVGGTALVNGLPRLLLIHYDRAGRLLWEKTAAAESTFSALATDGEAACYACGAAYRHTRYGTESDWLMLCFEDDGRKRWEKTLDGPAHRDDGTGVIYGNRYLVYCGGTFATGDPAQGGHGAVLGLHACRAENGEPLWTRWHAPSGPNVRFGGMAWDDLGGTGITLMGLRRPLGDAARILLVRYGIDGSLLWERELPDDIVPGPMTGWNSVYAAGLRGADLMVFGYNPAGEALGPYRFHPAEAIAMATEALTIDLRSNAYVAAQATLPNTGPTAVVFKYSGHAANVQTYDAARDFSPGNNPNGVWSYGWSPSRGGRFVRDTHTWSNLRGLVGWDEPEEVAGSVLKNPSPRPLVIDRERWRPGQLGIHPGSRNQLCIVRFTAPITARYRVHAGFSRIAPRATTTGYVLKNGAVLFGGGGGSSYDNPALDLSAGDTLDFACDGGSESILGDRTGLSAVIQR
jgi:DNA-binding SARP family transcriptional activator